MRRSSSSRSSRNNSRGFTLVEVLVALAIVAMTIPALLLTLDQQIDGTAYLRDRALARVVAVNRLGEVRLGLQAGRPLPGSGASGEEEMAGRRWYWRLQSEATEFPDLYRVSLLVSDREDAGVTPLYTLVSLLGAGGGDAAGEG